MFEATTPIKVPINSKIQTKWELIEETNRTTECTNSLRLEAGSPHSRGLGVHKEFVSTI